MKRIDKVLIANRGEIAVRIMSTCKEMGIRTVAIYAEPDRTSLHVHAADEAYYLDGMRVSDTYLNGEAIVSIARRAGVHAIHPGYGFLSENARFARLVGDSGLVFIGPPPEAIDLLGDKTAARVLASRLGIPVLSGSQNAFTDAGKAAEEAASMGFPLLLKAAAGGGGKGMRLVQSRSEFLSAFQLSSSEARNAFGDPRIYLEKFLSTPHHVEIQILVDGAGNAVSLGERDCSTQRRHQKMIEESPSPVIGDELRSAMSDAAIRLMKSAGYRNAGTVEFLVDGEGRFYFLEVNTRLQVEHPVTEAVTGIDMVEQQIRIASKEGLRFRQEDVRSKGHAIECRVYAEDPSDNFLPSVGSLKSFEPPLRPGVRVDSGARQGDTVGVHYDPLLAKVIAWGETRKAALSRMISALDDFAVQGVQTTIPFCRFILESEAFIEGTHHTQSIDQSVIAGYLKQQMGGEMYAAALIASAYFIEHHKTTRPLRRQEASHWKAARKDLL